jgi:hypothetical protein
MGHLGLQRTLQHRLGQLIQQAVRTVDWRPHFTASVINESSVSAENVSATWRIADFSLRDYATASVREPLLLSAPTAVR